MQCLPDLHAHPPTSFRRLAQAVSALLVLVGALPAARGQDVLGAVTTPPQHSLDLGLRLAHPAALQTGMSAGVGLGYLRAITAGGRLSFGARASWSTATEYSLTNTVRNDDLRLRLCGQVLHPVGRGSFGLRIGLGATAVYESSTVSQGSRAGLTGGDLGTTKWYLLPAGEVEGVVYLRVWHAWGMSLQGGPALHLLDGSARWGWSGGLGVLWQP
jgi:hypothetical protein